MSKECPSYRVNIHIDRTEYADVITELEQYSAARQPNHLRMLIRLGVGVRNGLYLPAAISQERNVMTASVVPISQEHPHKSKPLNRTDPFESRGLDPADFQFGQEKL